MELQPEAADTSPRPRFGRLDAAAAFAEADRDVPLTLRAGAEDDLVAIFEIAAGLAVRQRDVAGAEGAELVQAGAALVGRAGRGAAADHVAREEIAAVAGMVGDHLGERPIERRQAGERDPRR